MIEASLIAPAHAALLWQGGLPPLGPELANEGFGVLALCHRDPPLWPSLFPHVQVFQCPLPDEGGITKEEIRVACDTAERLAALHTHSAAKREANLRFAEARMEAAADQFAKTPRSPRRSRDAAVEIEALGSALAAARVQPALRMPPLWDPLQRPLTTRIDPVERLAMQPRAPVSLEEHLVLGWMALHAAEGRRILVTCLQGAGFLAALVLHVITGRPGNYCAQLVRGARPGALTNAAMLEVLARLAARGAYALSTQTPRPRSTR